MDALSEWAAVAGIFSREVIKFAAGQVYDEHVDLLLNAIEKLSDSAREELVTALENP